MYIFIQVQLITPYSFLKKRGGSSQHALKLGQFLISFFSGYYTDFNIVNRNTKTADMC